MIYAETIEAIANGAAAKSRLSKERLGAYFVHSSLAGAYVGLGIVLIFSVGAPLFAAKVPFTPALMGAAFGIALSLVIFAGSDLFTGNAMVMPIGVLARRSTWGDLVRVWAWSYAGNLAGSFLLAGLVVLGGTLAAEPGITFVTTVAARKMNLSFAEAFFRGVLCNWLVCLAVWISFRSKSETAKLVMIFWCLLAFIGSGYEHSVANMTLLGLAWMLPHGPEVSLAGLAGNLVPVTLGNTTAGAFFVGLAYWYTSPVRQNAPSRVDASLATAPDAAAEAAGR